METNAQLELANDFVQYTGQHIFLTGKAGTGKTTFLRNLKEKSHKRMIVVAPTGVAAINAGGVTIHSFFQLSFGPQVGQGKEPIEQMRFSREKINIIKSLDLLVIDEISMVRADLLDAIDGVLRRFKNRTKPFGGVQLLMIGDLQQLAPVVKDAEWELLRMHYDTIYFFSSKALRETSFVSIELTHVYRQQDDQFISLLNKVRENRLDTTAIESLNKRYIPDFKPKDNEGYITLCTHNNQAQRINERKLDELTAKEKSFKAFVEGNFPEYSYPTEFELMVKEQAQVMFVKNDISREKLFFNGKIGKITRIEDNVIYVKCPDDAFEIPVSPLKWENIKYSIDEKTNEIRESVEGSFTQYPLKLAWAITIHKSQGLTFEKAIIDAESSFAHGQVYVALSRCKTLNGLVLSTPISARSIINDGTINGFIHRIEENPPTETFLSEAKLAYQHELLAELFRFTRLRYLINNVNKQIDENLPSFPTFAKEFFRKMFIQTQEEIVIVSEKFHNQVAILLQQESNIEINELLQERIQKASAYFIEKINSIIAQPLATNDIDIDNKAVRKQFADTIAQINEENTVKIACLEICKNGFYLQPYLHTRAIASIEKSRIPEILRTKKEKSNQNIVHAELYNTLRAWRIAKADELNVPAFQIFTQKSLFELVQQLPSDVKSLKKITGLGSKKVSQFGAEILEIIRDYCFENKIPVSESLTIDEPAKKSKEDTKAISFKLFKEGKKLSEIADERGLSIGTVEGHLAHFIAVGELDISLFLTDEKLKKICNYFEKAESKSLGSAKEALGDDISYSEIRFVLKHLDYLAELNA